MLVEMMITVEHKFRVPLELLQLKTFLLVKANCVMVTDQCVPLELLQLKTFLLVKANCVMVTDQSHLSM
jgi:hypothetical protein